MKSVQLFLFGCLMLLSNAVWSQVSINNINLSYFNANCNSITVPITADLCGFAAGDVVTGTLDFGDGTIVNLNNYAVNTGSGPCDTAFYELTNHSYATSNTYTLTATLSGPNAANVTSTLVINSSNCYDFSGYVFNDLNGNCIQDAGELPSNNVQVNVALNNFIQFTTHTNSMGFYQLNSTAYATSGYTVKVGAVTGGTVTCPSTQSYSPSGLTANNLNFGLNITPSITVTALSAISLGGGMGCNDSLQIYLDMQVCNIPAGNIQLNLDYGDGTSANYTYPYNPQSSVSCETLYLGYYFPNHVYATAGNYNLVLSASASGLTASGIATISAVPCAHFSGTLFLDANSNCILDANELPIQNEQIILMTGGQSYQQTSDFNGQYTFSIPDPLGAQVDISPLSQSALSCPAQGIFVTNLITAAGIDFGFNPPAPSLNVYFGNNTLCGFMQLDSYCMVTQCGTNGPLTALIDFGDGTTPITSNNFNSSGTINGCPTSTLAPSVMAHNYASYGTYTITVTITDGTLSHTSSYIINLGPCANFNGNVFVDANSNCVSDAGEALAFQQVFVSDNSGNIVTSTTTDINGNYYMQFQFISGMIYNVYPSLTGPAASACYNITCPSSLNYLVTNPLTSNLDFGFTSSSSNFDNTISGITLGCCGILQAGTNRTLRVNYMNLLCADNSGMVTLTLEPNMTFNWANPSPSSVVGNVLTWSFFGLNNVTWNHFVDVNVSIPFLNNNNIAYVTGDTVCLTAAISSTSGTDIDMSNNTATSCFYIGTAYDPNDKHGMPQGIGPNGIIAKGTDIEYMIRFQNTGAAPAQQVYILDTLDTDIDPLTIKVLGSSHNMVLTKNGNQFRFDFPNIMLPDSSSNVKASQGFVRFLAKQKSTIAYGALITNTAHIHFDAQAAVVTNTTKHTIKMPESLVDVTSAINIDVFPNPLQDELHIVVPEALSVAGITLSDAIGRTLYQASFDFTKQSRKVNVSTSTLASGVYFININADGQVYTYKVTK
jgi:hypothetical protein